MAPPPLPQGLIDLKTRVAATAGYAHSTRYPQPYEAPPSAYGMRVRDREPDGMRHGRARDVLNADVWRAATLIAASASADRVWTALRGRTDMVTNEPRPPCEADKPGMVARRLQAYINEHVAAPPAAGRNQIDIYDASDYVSHTLMQSMSQRARWSNADLWRAHSVSLPAAIDAIWAAVHAPI